ncbi:MAG TPA: STAS domain-containing protein [Acidimicrobiales bacterium]|nr:STAS domain-containing protein [Acidimicrobiales bacterium]
MAKAMERFGLEITRDQNGPTVAIRGELDAYTAPRLRKLTELLVDGSALKLVFDLSETTFVDSTGLGVLVGAARRARGQDMEVVLDRPTAAVFRVLEITGVSVAIPVRNPPGRV